MNKIYLARHGQDEDNALGILNGQRNKPLTDIGVQQSHNLAGVMKEKGIVIDKVLSSTLIRTMETAQIIAQEYDLEVEEMPLLIERDFGVMSGQYINDIENLCAPEIIKSEKIIYFLAAPESESFHDTLLRARKSLAEIDNKYREKNILLVAHGDIGKMIYTAYYNLDWQDVLKQFHFGNSELLLLSRNINPQNAQIIKTTQHNS